MLLRNSLLVVSIGQQLHHKFKRDLNNRYFYTDTLGDVAASLFSGITTPFIFRGCCEFFFHIDTGEEKCISWNYFFKRVGVATMSFKLGKFILKRAMGKLPYILTFEEMYNSNLFVTALNVLDIPSSDEDINKINHNDIMQCYMSKVGAQPLELSTLPDYNREQKFENRDKSEQLYESSRNLLISFYKNPNLVSREVKRLVKQKWEQNKETCCFVASSDLIGKMKTLQEQLH